MLRLPVLSPLADPAPLLRIDGVRHALSEVAVLEASRRDAFPGTLRWTIELRGGSALLMARISGIGSGPPSARLATRLLDALRPVLLRAKGTHPHFVLCTVDRVHTDWGRVQLAGTCAPLVSRATDVFSPVV